MVLTVVYLRSLKPAGTPPVQPTQVAVAVPVKDLPAGTKITGDMLTTKQMQVDAVPTGAVTAKELLIGQTLADAAPAGAPIARGVLAEYAPGAGLSLSVPSGLRAVTVAVDSITGVGGFLQLGDRVDVLVTMDMGARVVTKTVLQDILVLGVGAEAQLPGNAQKTATGAAADNKPAPDNTPKPMPSVTLGVTPQQAQDLVLSVKKGTIHLALRPKSDNQLVAMPLATNTTVLGVDLSQPAPASGQGGTPASGATPATTNPGTPGTAPGAPGAVGSAAQPGRSGVEVFRGTGSREVVTP
jgi:pilus assembly protein CpaB